METEKTTQRLKVLAVDDEESLRSLWIRVLAKEGFEVFTAKGGEEAIESIHREQFAVIFSDMRMPGMSGEQLLEKLRQEKYETCVNIVTGLPDVSEVVKCMHLGACDYIQKPCNIEEMVTLARRCAGHAREREEKKRLKSQIAHYEELDRLKSEFVSNVSHELRTPLFSLRGAFDLFLEQTSAGADEPNKQRLISIMKNNLNRLFEVVGNVLNFSRLERGAVQLNLSEVDLVALVKESVGALEPMWDEKNIFLPEVRCPADKVLITADGAQIKQVLANYLSNAIKFTPVGGKIGVDINPRKEDVQLRIWDTGIGIAKENYEKVFERFFQVDGSWTREHGGSGIGLTIAKAIVELHAGRVWVESESGHGSSFFMTLPKISLKKEGGPNGS